MLVLKDLVGLYRAIQLQLFQCYWSVHRLDFHDIEWFALETEIILSFLRLHPSTALWTLVDYFGHSISSKGFLSTVVDIMVI